MAMFQISAMKSPARVFSNGDGRSHHVSVMVNGSVLSEEENKESRSKSVNNNKGRVIVKSSEEVRGASSRIYLGGTPAATAGSSRSSVAAGTTSIRVSEVFNRENQDLENGVVSIRGPDSSQAHPDPVCPRAPRTPFSLEEEEAAQPTRSNRFRLVHQSGFDEESVESVGLSRIDGYPNRFGLVSVTTSPVVTMVPGAPNHEQQNGRDNQSDPEKSYDLEARGKDILIENGVEKSSDISGPAVKSQYVSLNGNNVDTGREEWLNEVNLVPKLDANQDSTMVVNDTVNEDRVVVSDSNEELAVLDQGDVLTEGIKLRVSFGNRDQDEMVSRSPDDGYHDDDTLSEEESMGHPVSINETIPSVNDGIHVAIPVRLSDSSTNYDREMRFIRVHHVRHDSDVFEDDANSSLGSDTGTILSRRGTIRGMKNQVRTSIAAFLENMAAKRHYSKEESGRVVLYTTSMGVVRRTHDLCRRARNIMYTLMVRFEERDVFMNRLYQQEVCERLHLDEVIVPQLFVDGVLVGNADVIERLNEIGELRKLLEPYKRQSVGTVCQLCGDFRFLPCTTCGGSKKSSQHRHQFSEEIVALRCMVCDENGLIKCSVCLNDDQS